MRVRYKMAGDNRYQTKCDLTKVKAEKVYKDLYQNALCQWAELVGEDDYDYMEVIKSFDHSEIANTLYTVFGR